MPCARKKKKKIAVPPAALGNSEDHINAKEAASMLGVSVGTAYRLYHAKLLRGWRPSPRHLNIYRDSVLKLKQRTEGDPEFWDNHSIN